MLCLSRTLCNEVLGRGSKLWMVLDHNKMNRPLQDLLVNHDLECHSHVDYKIEVYRFDIDGSNGLLSMEAFLLQDWLYNVDPL